MIAELYDQMTESANVLLLIGTRITQPKSAPRRKTDSMGSRSYFMGYFGNQQETTGPDHYISKQQTVSSSVN